MSTRLFQSPTGGLFTTDGSLVSDYLAKGYTEVQVVPLDATVLYGPLPTVDPEAPGYSGYVGLTGPGSATTNPVPLLADPELHVQAARRELALAEYLRQHPPVDQEQVEALADLLEGQAAVQADSFHVLARRLVQAGVKVEVAP